MCDVYFLLGVLEGNFSGYKDTVEDFAKYWVVWGVGVGVSEGGQSKKPRVLSLKPLREGAIQPGAGGGSWRSFFSPARRKRGVNFECKRLTLLLLSLCKSGDFKEVFYERI